MNNANVLSHPTFDRTPILNRRGPGRLPRSVASLAAYRRTTAPFRVAAEETALRAWAYANGLSACADVNLLRKHKREQEALAVIEQGNDRGKWRTLECLESATFGLFLEVREIRQNMLDRYMTDGG